MIKRASLKQLQNPSSVSRKQNPFSDFDIYYLTHTTSLCCVQHHLFCCSFSSVEVLICIQVWNSQVFYISSIERRVKFAQGTILLLNGTLSEPTKQGLEFMECVYYRQTTDTPATKANIVLEGMSYKLAACIEVKLQTYMQVRFKGATYILIFNHIGLKHSLIWNS